MMRYTSSESARSRPDKTAGPGTFIARGRPRLGWAALYAALGVCVMLTGGCHHSGSQATSALPEVSLVDDHGTAFSPASLKGKAVLVDFIHVGCPGICTELTSKFGQVADNLGPDLGSKVILLSVTNDPEHDGPAQLLTLARSSDADLNGWLFVTGKPGDVDQVLRAFGLTRYREPDGSPNHINKVFLLGPDGRERHQYQGVVMNSQAVIGDIKEALTQSGNS